MRGMQQLPYYSGSQFICGVTFKVEPKVKGILEDMRSQKINVGKYLRDLLLQDLERRGMLQAQSRLTEVPTPEHP
jgi:hypothetical protein